MLGPSVASALVHLDLTLLIAYAIINLFSFVSGEDDFVWLALYRGQFLLCAVSSVLVAILYSLYVEFTRIWRAWTAMKKAANPDGSVRLDW